MIDELKKLETDGFVIVPDVFSKNMITKVRRKYKKFWKEFRKDIPKGKKAGITDFQGCTALFLGKGRYDLELDWGIFKSKKLIWPEQIKYLVDTHIGKECIAYSGSLPLRAGSVDGKWHRDARLLFNDTLLQMGLPCFYMTVLIPLMDINEENGATEFIVGSHKDCDRHNRVVTEAKIGDAIVVDGMTLHRGLGNQSGKTRHMLYVVYCRPWYTEYDYLHGLV